MPHVNLSILSGPELRGLLDATRRRGDATMSYQILQEMAARRTTRGPRGLFPARRPAEPRIIDVDLGDPMERRDEPRPLPAWGLSLQEPETAAPPEPVAEDQVLRLRPPEAESPRKPAGRRWPGAGFAAGAAVGVALGWGAGAISRETAPPPPAPPSPAAALPTAALTAPAAAPAPPIATPAPVEAPPETPPETPMELAAAPLPPGSGEGPSLSPDAADAAAQEAVVEVVETPAATAPKGCAAEPTPADQAICGDAELRRLQRDLRRAYAQALEAHRDRGLLRERQLAWREARNAVAQPDRLARLYEQRIRKLNAAAAEARRAR